MVIGLVILALLVMDFNNRMAELRRLRDQQAAVAEELTAAVSTQHDLETQLAYATSEAAVEEWAYVEGRWIREGDIPVAPIVPPGSTEQPTAIPETTPQVESNWEIWMSLFLDDRP